MDRHSIIQKNISDAIDLKNEILRDKDSIEIIGKIADTLVDCLQKGGKVLFCGNGGSAADAQHLAAELSGRYYYDRPPLFAEALHVNSSYLTAVANDIGFDEVYARMLEAIGSPGDVLIGMSTSGNSKNIVNALKKAKDVGLHTIAWTGKGGGQLKDKADILLQIPSEDTPRIQECHLLIGHALCEIVEKALFPRS